MADRDVLEGWQRHLQGLHDVARLIPFPYGSPMPDIPPERLAEGEFTAEEVAAIAEVGRPGRTLLAAMFDFDHRVPARCPKARRKSHGGTGTHELLAVHRQRLAIVQTRRQAPLPSGWRGSLYWLVDLELIRDEGHRGISVECRDCSSNSPQIHAFDLGDLLTIDSAIIPQRSGPPPTPDGYPRADEVAFAEVWGDLSRDQLKLPQPQLTIVLPPVREAAYREHHKDNPSALGHLSILAGYKQRLDLNDGHVTTVLPPRDPNQRVREFET